MKALKLAICAATASLALGGTAYAQDFSFNVGVASDYVFRGVSQTDEAPQVFGGVDVTIDKFYAGAWASNVDFYDSTDAEIDLYAGYKPEVGGLTFDFGVLYYGYVNEPGGADYAMWEFKAAVSGEAGPFTLGAASYYSPDFFGVGTDGGWYIEANAAVSPADKWTISGAIGSQMVDTVLGDTDYQTGNIGVSYAFTDNFSADLRAHTNNLDCGDICDSRVTIGIKATLP